MALTKDKKEEIVNKTADRLKKADIVVFTNFHGLNMTGMSELRKKAREDGVDYAVVKKRLLAIALKNAGLNYESPLEGEIGIAFGYDDPTSAARSAYEFAKDHKGEFKLVGGIYEGEEIGADKVTMLATIPTREVLLGQLANVLQAPITGLVRTLKALSGQQFVFVLERIKEQKG